jgi:hypothetical protein
MTVYIQTDSSGNFYNVNAYLANEGFTSLGWETIKYVTADQIAGLNPEAVVVGGIGNVRGRLQQLGIAKSNEEIDYPEELSRFFGRNIWTSTLGEIIKNPQGWGIFIKPKAVTKRFAGKVVTNYKDFIGFVQEDNDMEVWCSEVVSFVTEWRCFVRYGEILDIRQYKGAWDSKLDLGIVRSAIGHFKSAPASYALDFGVDNQGIMKLVEVNDGHSLGTYGMGSVNYAKFLSARWAELTNTKDYANF